MKMKNSVDLIGNLGADPELRYTQSGQPVANFRIATNERYTDRDGQKQERTEWHRIVVWGKLAENCGKFLAKGRQVALSGSLRTRRWEDREGVTRYTTEVVARNVQFLGGRGDQPAPQAELEPSVSDDSRELLDDQPF